MTIGANIKDRIVMFLQAEQLTASKFAESIGAQASSISHIMSGRNNPGYEFLYKLFSAYPRLNPNWMIMGKGEMYSDNITARRSHKETIFPAEKNIVEPQFENIALGKEIEKIIVFYTDKTFDTYKK